MLSTLFMLKEFKDGKTRNGIQLAVTDYYGASRKGTNRQRNILWFNPPYSQKVETKVGKCFLQLIDQCFPKTNPLHKIFNRKEINSWETKKNSKRHWILHDLALHVKCCLSLFSLRHISRRLYMSQSVLISCRAVDFLDTGFPPLLSFEVSAQF